jgi:ElaB/YqjD/DUF883 family membrane-anchored ribosome-binding protein
VNTSEDSLRAGGPGAPKADGLVAEMEDLLTRIAQVDDPRFTEIRLRLQDSLRRVRASTSDAAQRLRGQAIAAGETADEYVRERPWTTAGVAVLAGIAIGALISRR